MTWEYIDDHMTMGRLSAMEAYWKQNPPIHLLVRAYMGYEPPAEVNVQENVQGMAEFLAMNGVQA